MVIVTDVLKTLDCILCLLDIWFHLTCVEFKYFSTVLCHTGSVLLKQPCYNMGVAVNCLISGIQKYLYYSSYVAHQPG